MYSLPCAMLIFAWTLGPWALASAAQTADGPAQPKRKEPPPGVLHAVAVQGNRLYPSEDIIRASGLRIGQRVTAQVIEASRLKVLATELFDSVSDQYKFSSATPAYDVTFEVAENQQLFPMRFERLGDVSPEGAKQYLREHVELYSDRIPGTEGVLRRYTAAVQELVSKSHPEIKVKAQVSNDDPKQLAVLFTSNAPAPTISQVVVTGNQAIDTGTILRAVNQVAIGVPVTETRIKMVLDGAIKPLYAAKGYAAVSFPKVETEPSTANLGVVLKVDIKEGPAFKFGAIRFHGNGMDEEEIRSNIPFKPGQTFNSEQVDNFRLDMIRRMKRRGLLDADVTTETEPDDTKRLVNVVYNVVPGSVYNFQRLDIRGLDITTEPVIAKLWGEKPGVPFNPEYPDFFLKRVQEQGLFDNLGKTQSDYTADASTHTVTVHLYFKGGKSAKDKTREKQEEQERQKSDDTQSPYPPL
ncbi:MAG: POTRA domain-containing protein [Bryobacteraceae bacterium]